MHAFALFHDDVMDDAGTRRGEPTIHAVAAAEHAAAGWAGESRRFGEGVAILVGDLAFVYADQLLVDAPREAWSLWNELRIELNIGQYLDIVGSVDPRRATSPVPSASRGTSPASTRSSDRCISGPRSPRRTVSTTCSRHSSAYGLPLGDAFQMRDDVMGAFGDAGVTGKPVGGDLREGKPTPLLARRRGPRRRARNRPCSPGSATPRMDDATVAAIQTVIVDTGALADLEATIARLTDDAVAVDRSRTDPPRHAPRADQPRRVRQPASDMSNDTTPSASPSSTPSCTSSGPRPPPPRRSGRRHRCRARRAVGGGAPGRQGLRRHGRRTRRDPGRARRRHPRGRVHARQRPDRADDAGSARRQLRRGRCRHGRLRHDQAGRPDVPGRLRRRSDAPRPARP